MALYVDIRKTLGDFCLDVKFEAENEVIALLGASGCGKSMTLKCIAGIERPDEGKIILNGRTLFDSEKHIDLKPQQRRVGYLFQQYALFPNMTVYQNIFAAVRKRPDGKRIAQQKISDMRLTGLEDLRPSQLSGGQQQRVALARILANEPELMLLDEPFSALDSYLRWDLEMELRDTLQSFGGASVFVSHSREEVYRVCDSVCVLSSGKSEAKLSVKELFSHPGTLSACKLTGCKNLSRIERIGERRIRALDWDMELETTRDPSPDQTWMGIQARDIRISDCGTPCTIERVVEDEHGYILLLRTPGPGQKRSRLRMMMRKDQYHGEAVGNKLLISFPPEYIMLLKE